MKRSVHPLAALLMGAAMAALWMAAATTSVGGPSQKEVFDAFNDFSTTTNPGPDGAWSYGYTTSVGGTYNLLPDFYTPPDPYKLTPKWTLLSWATYIGVARNVGTQDIIWGGSVRFPASTYLHPYPGPNGEYTVVRWTAPATGNYSVDAGFRSLRVAGPKATTDVHVLHNGKSLKSGFVNGFDADGDLVTFIGSLDAAMGDSLDFVVGPNGDINSDSTGVRATITLTNTTFPPEAAPSDLAAAAFLSHPVELTWTDNSDGETGFQVERRLAAEAFALLGTAGEDITGYSDPGIAANTTYTYRVRAVNAMGVSPWSNEATVTTPAFVPTPAAPEGLIAVPVSESRVDLRWSDRSVNETAFEVERRDGTGDFATIRSLCAGSTACIDEGLLPDRTYTYRVRAVGLSNASGYTAEVPATTLPTLSVIVQKGVLKDSRRSSRDSVKVTGAFSFGEHSPDGTLDPAADGVRLAIESGALRLDLIVPGAAGAWKVRRGICSWKSPRGGLPKYAVQVDTVRGKFRFSISGLEFPGAVGAPVRVGFGTGDDGGSHGAEWTEVGSGRRYP